MSDGITGSDRALDMTSHIFIILRDKVRLKLTVLPAHSAIRDRVANLASVKLLFTSVKALWFFQICIISFPIMLGLERDAVSKFRSKLSSHNRDGNSLSAGAAVQTIASLQEWRSVGSCAPLLSGVCPSIPRPPQHPHLAEKPPLEKPQGSGKKPIAFLAQL